MFMQGQFFLDWFFMPMKNAKHVLKIDSLATIFCNLSNFFIFHINVFLIFIGIWSSGASEWIWLFMTYIFLAMVYKFTIIYCSKIGWTWGIADAMDQSRLGKSTYFWQIWKDRWFFREKLIEFYLTLCTHLILSPHPSTKWPDLAVISQGISQISLQKTF